jgi:uncharacterized protein
MIKNCQIENTPLLTSFKSDNSYYIYDCPTNEIVRVSKELWEIISKTNFWELFNENLNDIEHMIYHFPEINKEDLLYLKEAKETAGLFSNNRPKSLSLLIDKKQYHRELKNKIGQLILNITEQCNLQCDYCIYSGHYQNQRQHSKNQMSFEAAQSAVDFYFKHSSESEVRYIGFYGGEPILNFKTIKQIIKYIEETKSGEIIYNLTTNGYYLSDEIINFFIEHKFNLLISLDGPIKTHNRFRKNYNGKGTFHKIYENLCKLKRIDKNYFMTNVSISVVIGPPYNVKELQDFFDSDSLFEDVNFIVTSVSESNTTFFESSEAIEANKFLVPDGSNYNSMIKEYKQNLINGIPYKSRFLSALFENNFVKFHKRHIYPDFPEKLYANGVCKPGLRRILVAPNGKIYLCEKADSTMLIGDVINGFYFDNISKLINNYIKYSNHNCLNCFANRHCSACFATCYSSSGFFQEEKKLSCEQIQNDFISTLKNYCEILESNPSAFEFTKNIIFS